MNLFAKFVDEVNIVDISIYESSNDVLVDSGQMNHIQHGIYKYDFSIIDYNKDYYFICKQRVSGDLAVETVDAIKEKLDAFPNKDSYKADLTSLEIKVGDIYDGLLGKWEIKNNQLIMYRDDNSVLRAFDLIDKFGNPTETAVFKREIS